MPLASPAPDGHRGGRLFACLPIKSSGRCSLSHTRAHGACLQTLISWASWRRPPTLSGVDRPREASPKRLDYKGAIYGHQETNNEPRGRRTRGRGHWTGVPGRCTKEGLPVSTLYHAAPRVVPEIPLVGDSAGVINHGEARRVQDKEARAPLKYI